MSRFLTFLAALVWAPLLMTSLAHAQGAEPAARADAPTAHAPALRYESAFQHYRRFSTETNPPDQVWREANRVVGDLGGHGGHLAEHPSAAKAAGDTTPAMCEKHDTCKDCEGCGECEMCAECEMCEDCDKCGEEDGTNQPDHQPKAHGGHQQH
ncbi:MAG TPA: hypothetical protein VM406_05705 [Noviherbaspirillum sp.]|nr:hypothetical protein [Noviherbaspirillum sp.]